jgi:hypothetical protein
VSVLRSTAPAAETKSLPQQEQDRQHRNPGVPAALAQFAFLIGSWQCKARVKSEKGEWREFQATWHGRYILEGHAIADEYKMTDDVGHLIVLGMNFRTYDESRQKWNLKWLNALDGTWTDLGSDALGGVKSDDRSVTYTFREPVAHHAYTRATYGNISEDHFTWSAEKSDDGNTWSEFMVVECTRGSN